MSLSELSRLPVSNLRLSAHISAPWTRKKKKNVEKATKPRQKATKWTNRGVALFQVDAVRSQAAEAPGRWRSRRRPRALCLSVCGLLRPPCCLPGSELWKPHRLFVQQKKKKKRAAAQDFAKSACLNFYFCFLPLFLWHGEHTGPCLSAQRDLWPVIVGYTLFCVSVFLFSIPVVLPPHSLDRSWHPLLKMFSKYLEAVFWGEIKNVNRSSGTHTSFKSLN